MLTTHITLPNDGGKAARPIRLFARDRDGEVLAAVRALGRHLKEIGKDFHDLANVVAPSTVPESEPDWHAVVHECIRQEWKLRPKDREFLHALLKYDRPTPKQAKWLFDLVDRVRA
jgi:hypothetical protein